MNKVLGLVSIFLGLACCAGAQQVVEEDGAVTVSRALRDAAESMPGNFAVPTADNPGGSLIYVTGDFHNSDVTIFFVKERIDEFKPAVVQLLSRLNLRRAVVRVRRGRKIGALDIELNPYMEIRDNHSYSTVPLGSIVDNLRSWNLPQPLGVAILGSKEHSVLLNNQPLEEIKLIAAKDVGSSDLVRVGVERHWYGLVAMWLMSLFLIGAIGLIWKFALIMPKAALPKAPVEAPQTLGEAQARYEQASKSKIAKLFPLLMILAMAIPTLGRSWMRDAENWFDPRFASFMPFVMLLVIPPMVIGAIMRKVKKIPAPPAEQQDLGPLKVMRYMFIPMFLLMGVLLIQRTHPRLLYSIPAPLLAWIVRIVGFGPLVGMVVFLIVSARKNTELLGPGDADYDAAFEMAKKGGVRLRKVVVMKNAKSANAFARLFGTIGLTEGSRNKLTDEERRAVIAHELGHIKGQHVPLLLGFSLLTIAAFTAVEILIEKSKLPEFAKVLASAIASPIFMLPVLMFARSPLQRKAEYAADRFALEQIGSFHQVAVALAKIHLLNASPHTMTKFHESISSHPSLIKRLNALRDVANQLGWNVSATEVGDIIANLRIEPPAN